MVITDIRLTFIEMETLAEPLAARTAPEIPFAFLLNQAAYQKALDDAIMLRGPRRMPWDDDYGKLFWYYYLERKRDLWVTFNEAWRALVPLQEPAPGAIDVPWLKNAEVDVRTLIYPWGIGAIIDIRVTGRWTIDKAVELGLELRAGGKYDWSAEGKSVSLQMNGLMSEALATMRRRAYGNTAAHQAGEMFSIVTVLDAEKADADTAPKGQSKLHRALDAFVSWSPYWKKAKLDSIEDRAIRIKQSLAPPGHLLYGGSRGRAVWFPGGFPSSSRNPKGSLDCYHQNLAAAALQTESLCALARSAANRLAAGETIGAQSVTYGSCAKLAAGILGRLYGGHAGTYKSRSARNQIEDSYLADVNALRQAVRMPALQPA